MKKLINTLCIIAGFIFVGIGAFGVVMPILPATPFLILAAFFFARGSEKFYNWFVNTKLYKKHITSMVKDKAMTLKSKVTTLTVICCMFIIGFLVCPVWPGKILIIVVAVFHLYYFIFRIRTIRGNNG